MFTVLSRLDDSVQSLLTQWLHHKQSSNKRSQHFTAQIKLNNQ